MRLIFVCFCFAGLFLIYFVSCHEHVAGAARKCAPLARLGRRHLGMRRGVRRRPVRTARRRYLRVGVLQRAGVHSSTGRDCRPRVGAVTLPYTLCEQQ